MTLLGLLELAWPLPLPEGREFLVMAVNLLTFLAVAGWGAKFAKARQKSRRAIAGLGSLVALIGALLAYDTLDRTLLIELPETFDTEGSTHLLPWPSCAASEPLFARGPSFRAADADEFRRAADAPGCSAGSAMSFGIYLLVTTWLAGALGALAAWVATNDEVVRMLSRIRRLATSFTK